MIISDTDDGEVWRLKFRYGLGEISLIYYHNRDFLIEWPEEIKNISHFMTMGAFSYHCFMERDSDKLIEMLSTRTIFPWTYYTGRNAYLPIQKIIDNDMERRNISSIQIESMEHFLSDIESTDDSESSSFDYMEGFYSSDEE